MQMNSRVQVYRCYLAHKPLKITQNEQMNESYRSWPPQSFCACFAKTLSLEPFYNKALVAAGLLSLPLVSTLALHPSHPLKAWAGHVHKALNPALGPQPSYAERTALAPPVLSAPLHGLPCLMQQATSPLTNMWQLDQSIHRHPDPDPTDPALSGRGSPGVDQSPLAWLGRFQKALQVLQAADRQSEEGQERVLSSQQDEVVRMILTTFLDHPQPEVQAAAAEACAKAVQAFPISGISLLPLLLHRLQQSVAVTHQGESCKFIMLR